MLAVVVAMMVGGVTETQAGDIRFALTGGNITASYNGGTPITIVTGNTVIPAASLNSTLATILPNNQAFNQGPGGNFPTHTIIIGTGITGIANGTGMSSPFMGCQYVEKVVFEGAITTGIGNYAFESASYVKSVYFNAAVNTIDTGAFQ